MKLCFLVLGKYVLIMAFREIILLIFLFSEFSDPFHGLGNLWYTSSFFPMWLKHFFKKIFLEQGATWLIFCFYYVYRRTVGLLSTYVRELCSHVGTGAAMKLPLLKEDMLKKKEKKT